MGFEKKGLVFGKGRLETLTDGVFAIIMTILVFNISVPELILFEEGEYASERLSAKFVELWPDFLAYVISFQHSVLFGLHIIEFSAGYFM